MSTRSVLTVVGGVVGAYFGYPQLGLVVGSLVGGAVDPQRIEGPQINETGVQTSAEGVQRPIVWGTIDVTGNIMHKGPSVKTTTEESQGKGGGAETTTNHIHRSYAIRICEGPIAAVLRIWADNKLVYDMRTGSEMVAESQKWIANKVIYLGDESQLPDPTLVGIDADAPSHRGTAYIVFILEDLTDRAGSISQYRFEVAKEISVTVGDSHQGPTQSLGTYLDVDADGNPYMLGGQTNGSGNVFQIGNPGNFEVRTYASEDFTTSSSPIDTQVYANSGANPGADKRLYVWAADKNGYSISNDGTTGYCEFLINGSIQAILKPDVAADDGWWYTPTPEEYGGLIWFDETSIYIGVRRSDNTSFGWNRIMRFLKISSGTAYPIAQALSISTSSTFTFWMHRSRGGIIRAIDPEDWTVIQQYSAALAPMADLPTPSGFQATMAGGGIFRAFAVDESKGLIAFAYFITTPSAALHVDIYDLSGNLKAAHSFPTAQNHVGTRMVFSDENLFIQAWVDSFVISIPSTGEGNPAILADIVSDIYQRCGAEEFCDVAELTDEVAGFVCANAYTGADAIGKLIQGYWFDISGHDRKNYHPKRGAAVIETLTIDELLELPDTNTREQAIERPKKLHLRYKHAASGYAAVKATAPRANSPDVLTTGEAIIELPVVLDENQAARKADVMYKIVSTEVSGETEVTVPFRVGAKYVTGNALGLSLRGQTTRQRVDRIEFQPWRIKLALKPDRQSAYTSNLTGVPIPPPELPPSTIVGETQMAILDIPARTDSEDDLNYLVAVSGSLPPWYGALYQRSLDGGASYVSVLDIRTASIMGELLANVTAASEHFTDTTNVLQVRLYRDGQTLESISDEVFLSEGNPCAVENADGSWEIMQFQEAVQVSDGTWELSVLQRGQLSSGGSAHVSGSRFVMLQRPSHITASSSWLNADLTHRAISLGESADDTDNDETQTYVGRSQQEWAPAYLEVTRDVSTDILTANWVRRGRFGTAFAPVLSANYLYDVITFDDGTTSVSFNTTAGEYTYDASAMGPSVTVTVTPFNRITGAGPTSSETV